MAARSAKQFDSGVFGIPVNTLHQLAEVARALETSWPAAKRLEDPRYYPTLKQLEKAAAALGKKLVLSFE